MDTNSQTMSGVSSGHCYRTRRAACRVSTTGVCSTASFGFCDRVRHSATCRRAIDHRQLATIASFRWRRAAVWDRIMDALAAAQDVTVQMILAVNQ